MSVSFSSLVRSELRALPLSSPCCKRAELTALLQLAGSLTLGGGGLGILIETEHPATARRIFSHFRDLFSVRPVVAMLDRRGLGARHRYALRLSGPEALRVLDSLSILPKGALAIKEGIPKTAIQRACCRGAYLRGAYLACGSIVHPEKEYHLEFSVAQPGRAQALLRLIGQFDLEAKIALRKHRNVVYLKESQAIANMLTILGAHGAMLELENIRIVKGLRNDVNRRVNFETANLNKTVDASSRQAGSIAYLQNKLGMDGLPPPLRQIARLRLNNSEASLLELGQMHDPPLPKSGVNRRLKKLDDMARELRAQEGKDAHDP